MDEIPNYLKAMKSGNIVYDHPKLKSILSSTYGILVYQEEIMMAVRELAGFSKGAADTIRKAMGKKKIEIMNEYSNYFIYGSEKHDKENPDDVKNIPGCIKMGISESTARMIWDKMVKFASYAFNKSHATCYAALGARTAYLACHYPVEYTTGILNSFIGNNDKISYYVAKCNRKGVTVLPPDVNRSGIEFDVVIENEGKKIIFGLSGIKDVGTIAANAIVKERKENGKFLSIEDFLTRLSDEKVNKRVLTALAYTGAFDSFGQGNRAEIVASVPKMVEIIKAIKAENKNQVNMFDDLFETKGQRYKLEVTQKADLSMTEKSFKEKDYLGYFVNHPITAYSKKLNSWRSKNFLEDISEVVSAAENSNFPIKRKRIAGLIQNFKIINYKDKRTGNPKIMIVFSLNDETGTVKCVGYDEIAVKYSHLIHDKTIAYVLCNAKKDDFGVSCIVEAIHVFSEEEKD